MNAPIFAGLVVFIASSCGLLLEYITTPPGSKCFARRAKYNRIITPGILNTLGTLLQLGALVFIPAAILAGLRGVFIYGTAVASSFYRLRDAPVGYQEWTAVTLAAAGAVAVGSASALGAADYPPVASGYNSTIPFTSYSVILGISLSIAGYIIATCQVIFEQLSLDKEAFSRWEMLGIEGIVGTVITSAILLALSFYPTESPLIDSNSHTVCCLSQSATPGLLATAYGASSLIFNALLLLVASNHGPNARVFVFVVRGVLTWIVEIALFYAGSPGGVGRGSKLTPFSALEAAGWLFLIVGGVKRSMLQQARELSVNNNKEETLDEDDKESALLLIN